VRSPERARELGEVFTPEHIVSAMLDLLKDINYASKCLEPGCGSGNFLVEIASRKIATISKLPEVLLGLRNGSYDEFDFKCLIAAGSIYGVDIDDTNISEARERLLGLFHSEMLKFGKRSELPEAVNRALVSVINHNIILGDLINDAHNLEVVEFGELPSFRIKQRVFRFSELIFPEDEVFEDIDLLFGHVPSQLRDYPPVYFKELGSEDA
jgi:hypothetical protein